jgi:hypothetical protein
MHKLQGDKVLVLDGSNRLIFTIVHFVDNGQHELRLRNDAAKNEDQLPVTQAILDNLKPITDAEAKWQLVLS